MQRGSYEFLITEVCNQKLRLATDETYRNLCTEWTDKKLVYDKMRNLGLSNLLIPDITAELNINTIEDLAGKTFNTDIIVKCNHGSGWNKIIKANSNTDIVTSAIEEIQGWLFLNYAYIAGYEAQYENIIPGILIQNVLVDKPLDYGFWCINGEIKAISLTKKHAKNIEEYIAFVNPDYTAASHCIGMIPEMANLPKSFGKIVDSMKDYITLIAKQFDFVRVDMYHVNGKNYFGETTFTPCGGRLVLSDR